MTTAPDAVLRALADPTRRALFETLMAGESAVTELTVDLHISQPAVSQHLAILREAKLVTQRQEGRQRFYRADPEGLAPLVDWLEVHKTFWDERIKKLQQTLKKMK